jgi:hypothetical protein
MGNFTRSEDEILPMKRKLVLFFILLTNYSFGQTAIIKEIKQKNPITKEIYVFPKIIIQNAKSIELKINNYLRTEILFADSGISENKIFNKVWRTNEQSPTFGDITYKVFRNDKSILSISITGQGCGAYCETGTNYFTFNLNTGDKLTLESLFTKKGIYILVDSLNISKTKKIEAKIREIQNIIKSNNFLKDKNRKEYYLEMLDLYKNCLNRKIDTEFVSDLRLIMTNKNLQIYSGRCSAHYNMAVDELWEFEYTVDVKVWIKYLTPYGFSLTKK